MIWFIVAFVVLIAVGVVFAMRGRSKQVDGMSSFRRQIDALSPEARRPVVDQVQRAAKPEDDAVASDEQAD